MKKGFLLTIALAATMLTPAQLKAQGFPNVPQTAGNLLSGGLLEPNQGRTAIIAFHNGWLYTVPEHPSSMPGSDYQARRWNIADPTNAQVIETLGISGSSTSAHGFHKIGDYLLLGGNGFDFIHHETGEHHVGLSYVFQATAPNVNSRTAYPQQHPIYSRGDLYRPYYTSMFWSYGDIDELAELGRGTEQLAEWDHLGMTGVIGHPFIIGNLLIFASDQSRTGVATYDISDPTNPVLLDVLTEGGPGGYWPELWGGDGQLLIVFPYRTGGNGIRVVDVTDPSNMQFIADVPLPGASCMYAQFQDHHLFTGSHKVDMRTMSSVLSLDLEPTVLDTSQFALPLGNLLVTGGAGPGQGMAIWAHSDEPDTNGPSVGFHIPRAGQTNYPVNSPISLLIHESLESPTMINGETFIVRTIGGAPVSGLIRWTFNDSLTFTPDQPLLLDTTYEVVIPEGGITDAVGNGIEGYAFTFSTGASVTGNHAPEITAFSSSVYPALPAQAVTLTATAEDADGDSLEFRFDFGDGSDRTAWGAPSQSVHAYSTEGHFRALVQARDGVGSISSRALTVTVTSAIASSPPNRSTPVIVDEQSRQVWTVNPDNNSVSRIHIDSQSVLSQTNVGADPRSIALDQTGNAWVTIHDADRIDIISPTGSLNSSISLDYGDAPFGIAMSPDRQSAYISLQGSGDLVRYDTASESETGRLSLGETPRALALTPNGDRIYVSRFISPLHRGEIWEVDTASMSLVRRLEIEKFGGALHRDGTAEGMGVANYLVGLAVSPDGQRLMAVSNKMNTDKGALSGPDFDQDNTIRNIISSFDIPTGSFLGAIDIDNSDSASAVAYSPLGDYVFVTLQGNDDLLVLDHLALDSAAGLGSFVTRRGVGSAPQGLSFDPETNQILVKNFMGRSLSFIDASGLLQTGRSSLPISEINTVSSEQLSAEVLLGKTLFYHAGPQMSGEGYISCATCHLDGAQDGRIWDFTGRGEGLRNSITLRGRSGTGHGRVHWSANFDEIQDFEHDIRGFFGGSGFLSDAEFATSSPLGTPKAGLDSELDALAAYVTSLDHSTLPRSPYRQSNGALSQSAIAGQTIFETMDCRTCHEGANMIDLNAHNVGTLRDSSGSRLGALLEGIDTPSLRGIWNTPPYLHDGSAATIEDVFTVAGGQLYPAEAGVLTGSAYLNQGATVRINADDTARGEAFVAIEAFGSLTFQNVDGGSGGTGALEFRYTYGDAPYPLNVTVNGAETPLNLLPVENGTSWRFVNWRSIRMEQIELNPGPNNTIVLSGTNPFFNVYIDDIVVSTSEALGLAQPHRQVLNLVPQDRANLLAYLQQLDGSPIQPIPTSPPGLSLTSEAGTGTTTSDPVVFHVLFERGVTGLDSNDLILGGTANPQNVTIVETEEGIAYEIEVTAMQNAGSITLQIAEDAVTDLAGQSPAASDTVTVDWEPFVDDLAPLGDEFSDASTLTTWQRLNDAEGWNANKIELLDIDSSAPGHMRIMPYTTSWFMDLTGPLVFKEISGDFAVTMRMNVQRRNDQPGRPLRQFSLGGIMIRTPREIESAAPTPSASPLNQLPWPPNGYTTDWTPDSENYIFLSVGTSDNTGPENIWNYEVKTTIDGNSTLYYGRDGVPADTGLVTLQAIRRGNTFVLLRQHDNGDWIVENRYDRPDMPDTLQVGITTYTDWENIMSNGMYTNSDNHQIQYHHNRNVLRSENGFNANPDLVVDVDYVHYTRPRESITEQGLIDLPLSAGGTLQWLADTPLAERLGDGLNHSTPPPFFSFNVIWPTEPIIDGPLEFDVIFPQPVSGFEAGDLIVSGTAQSQDLQIIEILDGSIYRVSVSGMLQAGSITVQFPEGIVQSADGHSSAESELFTIQWEPSFQDDLAHLSDEFEDSSSITNWQRLNAVEGWNADKLEILDVNTTTPGNMHLMPHSSSWYMDLVGPMVYKEISGDFIVTTEMDIRRRHNQPGRPNAYFSLGGIMMRAPRNVHAAAPQPSAPPYQRLSWPLASHSSDWTPDSEDYLFLSAGHSIGYGPNQWNVQVKSTNDGQSSLYHTAQGIPEGVSRVTLKVVRSGSTFLVLRRHGDGDWIIENRYSRPDLPDTLQVGITTYTDWSSVAGNGMFTHAGDHESQFHHNRNVIAGGNGFGANPDLVADVDFFRFARPNGFSLDDLLALPLSAESNELKWLADTALAGILDDSQSNAAQSSSIQQMSISKELPLTTSLVLPIKAEYDAEQGAMRFQLRLPAPEIPGNTFNWMFSEDLISWEAIENVAKASTFESRLAGEGLFVCEIPLERQQLYVRVVRTRQTEKSPENPAF